MSYVVNAIFFVVYYLITIPICLVILAFWIVMLVIAILVMVLVMVAETWLSNGVPSGPMAVIERVKTYAPKLIGDILRRPLRKLGADEEGRPSRGLLAFIYSEAFTGIVLPILACAAVITLFATFGSSLAALKGRLWPVNAEAHAVYNDMSGNESPASGVDAGGNDASKARIDYEPLQVPTATQTPTATTAPTAMPPAGPSDAGGTQAVPDGYYSGSERRPSKHEREDYPKSSQSSYPMPARAPTPMPKSAKPD